MREVAPGQPELEPQLDTDDEGIDNAILIPQRGNKDLLLSL